MVKIETDYGTFEAETERDALKLSRKAKRAAAKEAKLRATRQEQARLKAAYNGWRLHEWMAEVRLGERETIPLGIRLERPGDKHAAVTVVHINTGTDEATYDRPEGRIRFQHFGYHVEGVLTNGAGIAIVTILRDRDNSERIEICALGSHERELVLLPLSVRLRELKDALYAPKGTMTTTQANQAARYRVREIIAEGLEPTVDAVADYIAECVGVERSGNRFEAVAQHIISFEEDARSHSE